MANQVICYLFVLYLVAMYCSSQQATATGIKPNRKLTSILENHSDELHDLKLLATCADRPGEVRALEPRCCFCGRKKRITVKQCVRWYVAGGKCLEQASEKQSFSDMHCGREDISPVIDTNSECESNPPCKVNKVEHATGYYFNEGTDADVKFWGVTDAGEECYFGALDKPWVDDRTYGSVDTYENLNIKCDVCMRTKDETWAAIKTRLSGRYSDEDWIVSWLYTDANGNYRVYGHKQRVTDKKQTVLKRRPKRN